MNNVQLLMWIGLSIYLVALLYLGYIGYQRTKSVADFAIAGESLGPITLGLAFSATFFSSSTFLGYPGWAYQWGFSSLWIFLTIIFASSIGLIAVAKRARRLNIKQRSLSLADWLGDRYNSDFVRVGAALISLFNVFYITAQLAAGAWIFNVLLGTPYHLGLALIAIIVMVYVFAGGSFSDVYTDVVQAVLMAMMGVVVFLSIFWMFPGGLTEGFTHISNTLAQRDPNLVSPIHPDSIAFYSIPAIVGAFIIQFAFSNQPQLFNKVLALKKPQDMRKMIITYVISAFCFLLVIFGGLYAAVTVTVDEMDKAILEYVLAAFPPIGAAFLGIVVIAAAMSTTDGIFVVMSTSIANDIYRKFLVPRGIVKTNPEKVEATAFKLSRYTVIVIGIVAFLLALNPPDSIGMYIWIGISGVVSGTLGPLLIGIYFPKLATATAAKVSLVTGVLSYLIIALLNFEKSTMAAGAWAVLIGVAAMVIAGYFTKPKKQPED
ncbi:MAG: sodium:solute symporter family transporter [Planifilum sp.]|jgi:sodium/pantothenate symporter